MPWSQTPVTSIPMGSMKTPNLPPDRASESDRGKGELVGGGLHPPCPHPAMSGTVGVLGCNEMVWSPTPGSRHPGKEAFSTLLQAIGQRTHPCPSK